MSGNRIKVVSFSLTTDGSGDATETKTQDINGEILAVEVDYSASASANTDLTITASAPSETILTLTDTKTDGVYYPRRVIDGTDGSAASAGDNLYQPFIVQGVLTATIAQGGDTKTSTVKVYWR